MYDAHIGKIVLAVNLAGGPRFMARLQAEELTWAEGGGGHEDTLTRLRCEIAYPAVAMTWMRKVL